MSTLNTKINCNYDNEDDILYLSIGEPEPSITNELEEGVFLRRSVKTKKITGLTILDYKYKKNNKIKISVPKEFDLREVRV
nr:MAG TPA: Protein of unknown function (DUF2283) [Caudoviricetes sp.]